MVCFTYFSSLAATHPGAISILELVPPASYEMASSARKGLYRGFCSGWIIGFLPGRYPSAAVISGADHFIVLVMALYDGSSVDNHQEKKH